MGKNRKKGGEIHGIFGKKEGGDRFRWGARFDYPERERKKKDRELQGKEGKEGSRPE